MYLYLFFTLLFRQYQDDIKETITHPWQAPKVIKFPYTFELSTSFLENC